MILKYEHLLGRRFEHGKTDCYTILRDFYQDNYGIVLTDYARPDRWWDQGLDLYHGNFMNEGFETVDFRPLEIRPGDVFLMAIQSSVANHSAVYLGDNKILHHFVNRLSSADPFRGPWRSTMVAAIRHRDVVQDTASIDLMDHMPTHLKRRYENGRSQ